MTHSLRSGPRGPGLSPHSPAFFATSPSLCEEEGAWGSALLAGQSPSELSCLLSLVRTVCKAWHLAYVCRMETKQVGPCFTSSPCECGAYGCF